MNTNDLKILREALQPQDSALRIKAIAALDRIEAAQSVRKVLTDEEIERIRITREREDGRMATTKYGYGFRDGLRYARDNGYLAPSTTTDAI